MEITYVIFGKQDPSDQAENVTWISYMLYMNKAWSESAQPPRTNANNTQLVVQIKLLEMLMVPSKET
jgi:hypothetical protein